jgi:hypothetical protein
MATPTIMSNATAPPTVPPITAPESFEEVLAFDEAGIWLAVALTEAADVVDEGTVDESSTLSAPKYSYCSALSMTAGSSMPSGHVELFTHGLALQHPQNVGGMAVHVQKSVLPPQLPPGDLACSFVAKPAGRRKSPIQPVGHGSEVQHPMNLDPVSHAYLIVSVSCSIYKADSSSNDSTRHLV